MKNIKKIKPSGDIKVTTKKKFSKKIKTIISLLVILLVLGVAFYFFDSIRRQEQEKKQAEEIAYMDDFTNFLEIFSQNNLDEAISKAKELISTNPQNVLGYLALASSYVAKADVTKDVTFIDQAKETLNNALESAPESSDVHKMLGDLYILESDYENALKEYNLALDLDYNSSVNYEARGDIYNFVLGDYDLAIEDYKKAVELDSDNSLLLTKLASTYTIARKFNEVDVKSLFLKALSIESNPAVLATIYDELGSYYFLSGRTNEGMAFLYEEYDAVNESSNFTEEEKEFLKIMIGTLALSLET
jgi:tetratricopeptide (TPR) repeat protein